MVYQHQRRANHEHLFRHHGNRAAGRRHLVIHHALVDTGSTLSKAPREILQALGVQPAGTRQFTNANNQVIDREVGRVIVRIQGRDAPDLIMFGDPGEQPLIGARTLEGLFLGVDPVNERLIPINGLNLSN